MDITSEILREKWFSFWKSKNHTIISSAGVLPENDPTALFHNSGMHPLVPYFGEESHPKGKRLANSQKCIRTGDIEEVGDPTHLTFFEMLGNWSLGDYFKKEQIAWSYEFLTEILKIPREKLAVSVFVGNNNAPRDEDSAKFWLENGIEKDRIAFLPESENWWKKGETGPCGSDTEIFFWTGEKPAPKNFQDSWENENWVEIWNDVFMEFNREKDGSLTKLVNKNIDTGMGLERTVAVLNGKNSVYETDVFREILEIIIELSPNLEKSFLNNPTENSENGNSARIIADHLRSSTIILADKISPSNTDQGYILRRLIRRAVRHGRKLKIEQNFCSKISKVVIKKLGKNYSELKTNEDFILNELAKEEAKFAKTLEQGEKEFEKIAKKVLEFSTKKELSGKKTFYIYETYGFPLEMTEELAKEYGLKVDKKGFFEAQEIHRNKSRAGAEQKFKGGLAEHSDETEKLHTATHLLHSALRKVLGNSVEQRGSNITAERLRFDFSWGEKLTDDQISAVEKYVNEAISANCEIVCEETTVEKAKELGAIGLFEDKYEEKIKMYTIGKFSREICGGPHAKNTGDLKSFKIKKQESCGAGVRRIKAVIG